MGEEQTDGAGEKTEPNEDNTRDGPGLTPVFALGFDASVRCPVHYADARRVVYSVGSRLATLDYELQQMQFVGDLKSGKITCLALAQNRKYLAVAEKSGDREATQISIYGHQGKWKRVRSISVAAEACPSKDITSLCFTSDNKYLVTVGNEPDWTLLYWRWASGKVVGSYALGNAKDEACVKRLSSNPWEHTTVATSGAKELRIFKLPKEDAAVKVSQPTFVMKGEAPLFKGDITDHAWLDSDSLAFSTDAGSVVIVNREEVETTIEIPHPCTITSLVRVGRGFLAVDRRGRCTLFELAVPENGKSGKPSYVHSKSFHALKDGQCIRSLSLSASEEEAVGTIDSHSLGVLTLAGPSAAEWSFLPLFKGFHQGPVLGVDVCVQRPLIATFGLDQTVRIWNFLDRQIVLAKQLDEDVCSLALHPSGMYLVLGVRDKLRLFNVLANDLLLVREFHLPACKKVYFSHSGHLFVASNGSTTLVFNTYTQATVGTLRGHTAAVRSISWAANDQRLVTVGMDGAVYEWKIDGCARDQSTENVLKSVQYTCVAYGQPGGPSFYVTAGRDKICRLRHMINGACEHEVKIDGCQITALSMVDHNRTLLAATDEGTVRIYPWFGNKHPGEWSGEKPGRFEEIRLHQGAVTSMCISPDQSLLFTTGEDGVVFTCQIHTLVESGHVPRTEHRRSGTERERWSYGPDTCLVSREEYRETVDSIADLTAQIEQLQRRGEYQTMMLENKRRDEVAAAKEETEAVRQAAERNIDGLNEEIERLREDHARQVRALKDAHLKTFTCAESEHSNQLEQSADKLARAHVELEDARAGARRALEEARARHEREMRVLGEEVEEERARARAQVAEARRQAEEAKREAEERKRQQDEEYEIAANKNDLRRDEQKFESEKKESELRARASILRRDLDGAILARRIAQEELCKREEELQLARAQIAEGGIKHQSLLGVLAEREETLFSMEQTINNLRGQGKELEVHKFLATHKLQDMHAKVAPREDLLARLKEQLEERDDELQKSALDQDNLRVANCDQAERIAGLKKEVAALQATIKARESKVAHFEHDLSVAMTEVDIDEKQRRLQQLYDKHCGHKQKGGEEDLAPEALVEMGRQRAYLEHTSRLQQKTSETLERKYTREMKRAREENQLLLTENMDLRQDKKTLLQQLQKLEERSRLHPQATAPGSTSTVPLKAIQTPRLSSPHVPRFSASALAAANAVREGSASSTSRSGRLVRGSVSRSMVFNSALDEDIGGLSRPATNRESVIEAQKNEIAKLKAQLQEAREMGLKKKSSLEAENQGTAPEEQLLRSGAQTERPWTVGDSLARASGTDQVRKAFKVVGVQPESLIPLLSSRIEAKQIRPSAYESQGQSIQATKVSQVGGGFLTGRRQSSRLQQTFNQALLDKAVERRKSMPAVLRPLE